MTTNFDRLLEQALAEVDVFPSVISSNDGVKGAEPLVHARCTVVKLHGDYKDPRVRNTPDELRDYDPVMDQVLDRILDEYGLVVCGWSAEWDIALGTAIQRCPNRRYTTFWSAYRDLGDAAQRLCQNRKAQIIRGMDADTFFEQVAEKVATLRAMDAPHPLSAPMATSAVKRYIPDSKERIRLHDMALGEARKVAAKLFSSLGPKHSELAISQYESGLEILFAILATGGYWGTRDQRKLWVKCFEAMVTPRSGPFPGLAAELDFYPCHFLLYGFGIAALSGGRPGNLGYLLANARAKTVNGDDVYLIEALVKAAGKHFQWAIEETGTIPKDSTVAVSRYLIERLRKPLAPWVPEATR